MKKLTLFLALILSVSALAQTKYVLNENGEYDEKKSPKKEIIWDLPEELIAEEGVTKEDVEIFTRAKHDTIYPVDTLSYIGYESWMLSNVEEKIYRSLSYDGEKLKVEVITKKESSTFKVGSLLTLLLLALFAFISFVPKSFLEKLDGPIPGIMLQGKKAFRTMLLSVVIAFGLCWLGLGFGTGVTMLYVFLILMSFGTIAYFKLDADGVGAAVFLMFIVLIIATVIAVAAVKNLFIVVMSVGITAAIIRLIFEAIEYYDKKK